MQLRLRIDFAPGCSVGPGKVALLEAIQRCGSLSEAARQLGMSYRRGWLLLAELNRSFDEPLATTAIGGSHGGGARLTALGEDVIAAFRTLEREANALARKRLARLLASGVKPAASRSAATRAGASKPRARSLTPRKRSA